MNSMTIMKIDLSCDIPLHFRFGSRFIVNPHGVSDSEFQKDKNVFILSLVRAYEFALISLQRGNRWDDPARYRGDGQEVSLEDLMEYLHKSFPANWFYIDRENNRLIHVVENEEV